MLQYRLEGQHLHKHTGSGCHVPGRLRSWQSSSGGEVSGHGPARSFKHCHVQHARLFRHSQDNFQWDQHNEHVGMSHSAAGRMLTWRSEWTQMTFQVPSTIPPIPVDIIESVDNNLDNARWFFYRQRHDQCPAWASMTATTNREKAKLVNIIRDVNIMLYTPHGPSISARDILEQYSRYTAWRKALPAAVECMVENISQPLPHVLSLQ